MRLFNALRLCMLLSLMLGSSAAFAQNTGGVFGPVINDGTQAIEYRFGMDPDTDAFAHRFHYQRALDGEKRWRVIAQFRDGGPGGTDFDFLQGEWHVQLSPDSARWQHAVRFDLRVRDGGRPATFGVNWTHQFPVGDNWRGRAILLTTLDVGDNRRDGVGLGSRFQLGRKLDGGHMAGFELYSGYGTTEDFRSLSEQSHLIGPFASLQVAPGWELFTHALFGATDGAPDTNLALWLTRKF